MPSVTRRKSGVPRKLRIPKWATHIVAGLRSDCWEVALIWGQGWTLRKEIAPGAFLTLTAGSLTWLEGKALTIDRALGGA